jgi:Holliday junction resolvase RusA-like endonuclease
MKVSHEPIYFSLPLPPSQNNMFVNGKAGRGRFISLRYKAWKNEAAICAYMQNKARIEGPFAIQINAVRPHKRRRDIDNYIKPLVDFLVSQGFVSDDSEMQQVTATWVEKGPPIWLAVRPCTRWAVDVLGEATP